MSSEFRLMPLVATLEMKAAGQAELERQDIPPAEMQTLWFAMSNAAPQPPALGGDAVVIGYRLNAEAPASSGYTLTLNPVAEGEYQVPVTDLAPLQAEIERQRQRTVRACQVAIERSQQKKAADAEVIRLKARLSALEDQSVWQPLADDDLAEAEKFINDHTGKAAFFSKDAATLGNYAMHCIREVRASRQLKAQCDELEGLLRESVGMVRGTVGNQDEELAGRIEAALSKPAGSERVCHLCRGEGRVGGPAPDEGGGKNCGLCDGTGMDVQS